MRRFNILLCWSLLTFLRYATGIEYCSENLFRYRESGLQFTKELQSVEYGIVNSFKSLHCCASGYTTIEWYKEERAYPWAGGTSSFILSTGSGNQTIYASSLTKEDGGRYKCIVSNQTVTRVHSIQLTVFDGDNGYADFPLPTYTPSTAQKVPVGGHARFYCEAFVGKIDLPDARNEIGWYRSDINNSLIIPGGNVRLVRVNREGGLTVGLYMSIDRVRKSDYGEYSCVISNAGDQSIEMETNLVEIEVLTFSSVMEHVWLNTVKVLFVIILLCILIYFLLIRYGYYIVLHIRRLTVVTKECESTSECDVLLLHEAASNEDFVISSLIPHLRHSGYVVQRKIIDCSHSSFVLEPTSRLETTKCLLVVIKSQKSLNWILQKLRSTYAGRAKVILLLTHSSYSECACGANDQPYTHGSVKIIHWFLGQQSVSKIWEQLRLHLPLNPMKSQRNSNTAYA